MIVVLEDEADSFFCFERLMCRLVLVYLKPYFQYVLCIWYGTKRLCFLVFFKMKSEETSGARGDLLELKLNLLICLQLLRLLTPSFTNI